MNHTDKHAKDHLIKALRDEDRKEYESPRGSYQPALKRSWLDKLAFVDSADDDDLAEQYRYGG